MPYFCQLIKCRILSRQELKKAYLLNKIIVSKENIILHVLHHIAVPALILLWMILVFVVVCCAIHKHVLILPCDLKKNIPTYMLFHCSFLSHLSHSAVLLLWVGARRRLLCFNILSRTTGSSLNQSYVASIWYGDKKL